MNRNNKIILILLVGAFLGIFTSEYMYDRDFDGVPNDSDDFPDNANEWKDSDQDGIGDNEDLDDDNDGYNDTDDYFPNNSNEYNDNDLDGIGDNEDLDDDNDGFLDLTDINPFHDVALKFNVGWVELIDKQNNRPDAPLVIYLYQGEEQLHSFDNDNNPWRVPWQETYTLNSDFELNIPDNQTEYEFTIVAIYYKFRNPEEFDISESNETYWATILYNYTTNSFNRVKNWTLDGTLDDSNENDDARIYIEIETYSFGYLLSYTWKYNTVEYQLSYNFDPQRYAYYKNQGHYVVEYSDYIKFVTKEETAVVEIAQILRNISNGKGFDSLSEVNFIMSFVQSLKYSEDNLTAGVGEYPRYPIETLVEQTGDCEDSSALLISLLESLGYEAAMVLIPEAWDDYGHAAVGVNLTGAEGIYYILNEGEENEIGYYFAETTAEGWKLGEIPDLDSRSAYVYEA